MKKLLLILFLSGFTFYLNAQPTTWAQPGAHWYYSEGDNVPIGSFGYFEIWEDGDTLFSNGITCDILRTYREGIIFWMPGTATYSEPGPTWYTYQNNDTVFIYYNNQFNILFINNQLPGQQFVTGPDHLGICDGDTVTIDSLYSVTLSGFTMNKIVPVVPDWWDGQWPAGGSSIAYHYPIYSRFGSTAFFVPAQNCVTDIYFGPLRCYSDSAGFNFTMNITPTCNYVTAINEINAQQKSFSVYPNPAREKLFVVSKKFIYSSSEREEFLITQIDGKLVSKILLNTDNSIDISFLQKGYYLLKKANEPQLRPVPFCKL